MTRVVETSTGAQVLPPSDDQKAKTSSWIAHLANDADLRARSEQFQRIAASLEIRK